MTTKASAKPCGEEDLLLQGDVFKDVKYMYVDSEDDEKIYLIELEFPYAIIVSQACDVYFMSKLQKERGGKVTKYMPSILMCPIYNKALFKVAKHIKDIGIQQDLAIEIETLYNSNHEKIIENGAHYRFYTFDIQVDHCDVMSNAILDFKHSFSVPTSYLLSNISNRLFSLDTIFAEQITLKFATYLSRVAIP